jgi:hypothetical protein
MVHQEQKHFGKPSRNGYHNKQWSRWMERIGLVPSATGAPGGKRTGQRMTHYIIRGGAKTYANRPDMFLIHGDCNERMIVSYDTNKIATT